MDKQTLRSYALMGAQDRLTALRTEEARLLKAFPELASQTPRRKRKRTFTAAERKAIAVRMKKYWASRRKAAK